MHRALCMEPSQMGSDGHGGAKAGGERGLKLFGVRIMGERGCGEEEEEEVMRKSASMGNLVSCEAGAGAGAEHGSEIGYLSDGGLVGAARRRRGGQERKRGVPWTEEEHRTFLAGLKKLGKGDWRGISRNFVPTRTPTQVASHAQKYFLRQSNPSKKKRRSSLFDVVIDETAIVAETDPTLSSKKTLEATKETDHLCKDNHLVGIPSFNTIQLESGGAMASQASPMTTTCSNATNFRSLNFMAGISGLTKGPKIPSLVWAFSITEQGAPPFGTDSAAVVPDFLKLSLTHPHRPAQSSAASAAFMESSDLDLSIGPPRPHNLAQLSSPHDAGAIRVV